MILLGEMHTRREKVCRIAAKLLRYKVVEYRQGQMMRRLAAAVKELEDDGKVVVVIKSMDVSDKVIGEVVSIVK